MPMLGTHIAFTLCGTAVEGIFSSSPHNKQWISYRSEMLQPLDERCLENILKYAKQNFLEIENIVLSNNKYFYQQLYVYEC